MQKLSAKIPVVAALLCALVAGGVAWQQRQGAIELERRVASLKAEMEKKSGLISDQEALIRQLRQENETYNRESASLREKLSAQASAPAVVETTAEPAPAASPLPRPRREFAKMFDDPKMKKMFRQSQQLQLKQLYNDFIKERHLDSRQSEQFFDLMTDGELQDMEDGFRSLDGDQHDSDSNGVVVASEGGFDRQLRSLLGEGNYAAYQDYKQTLGDRMTVAQIRQNISLTGSSLRDDQAKALLQVMTEERSRNPDPLDPNGAGSYRDKIKTLMNPDGADKYLAASADRNQRILKRMAGVMTQDQYDAFERFMQHQLEMAKIGIEMTRDFMENDEDSATHTYSISPK